MLGLMLQGGPHVALAQQQDTAEQADGQAKAENHR